MDDARWWSSHQVVEQYPVLTLMTRLLTSYVIKSKVDGHWLKEKKSPPSSHIHGEAVEYADNLMSLGVTMSESWRGPPALRCWWRRHNKNCFFSENLTGYTLYWTSRGQQSNSWYCCYIFTYSSHIHCVFCWNYMYWQLRILINLFIYIFRYT